MTEKDKDHYIDYLKHFETYNKETLKPDKYSEKFKEMENFLARNADKSGLNASFLKPLSDTLLPYYVRADLLALKYQKIHMLTGILVYVLGAAAVATVTLYMLFFSEYPKLLLAEFVEVALILILLIFAHFGEWQRKWIDYRFLAERLRVALFLSVAGTNCKTPKLPPYQNIPHMEDDWTVRSFSSIWAKCPQALITPDIEPLKKFLLTAWIGDQVSYYNKTSEKHGKSHTIYKRTGETLFALTIVVATIDATGLGHSLRLDYSFLPGMLVSFAIILPTASAALAGIRFHREYQRNSERYAHMARYLTTISEQINMAQDMKALNGILEEANEMLFLENWDWRAAFWLRKMEAP